MGKTYIEHEVFLELIVELAESVTEVKFGENTYVQLPNLDFMYSDDAQDYFNEMVDEYQGLLESLGIVSKPPVAINKEGSNNE